MAMKKNSATFGCAFARVEGESVNDLIKVLKRECTKTSSIVLLLIASAKRVYGKV